MLWAYQILPLLCWGGFLLFFFHKWVLKFVKSVFYIYWDDHIVFIFQFVNIICHFDWFAYTEESLHPWNKSDLIMVHEFSNVWFNSVCQNFVEDFCLYVHQWYWPATFFVCCLCLALVSGWFWPHRMSLEVFLLLKIFWKSSRKISISSSLNVW